MKPRCDLASPKPSASQCWGPRPLSIVTPASTSSPTAHEPSKEETRVELWAGGPASLRRDTGGLALCPPCEDTRAATCKPGRGAHQSPDHATTRILDARLSEWPDKTRPLLKCPGPRRLAMAALAARHTAQGAQHAPSGVSAGRVASSLGKRGGESPQVEGPAREAGEGRGRPVWLEQRGREETVDETGWTDSHGIMQGLGCHVKDCNKRRR